MLSTSSRLSPLPPSLPFPSLPWLRCFPAFPPCTTSNPFRVYLGQHGPYWMYQIYCQCRREHWTWGRGQHEDVEVDPDLADLGVGPAERVAAGPGSGGAAGVPHGVGVVPAGAAAALWERTLHSRDQEVIRRSLVLYGIRIVGFHARKGPIIIGALMP